MPAALPRTSPSSAPAGPQHRRPRPATVPSRRHLPCCRGDPGFVGSLVVCLPVAHDGGALRVSQGRHRHECGFGEAAARGEVQWAAFFSDAEVIRPAACLGFLTLLGVLSWAAAGQPALLACCALCRLLACRNAGKGCRAFPRGAPKLPGAKVPPRLPISLPPRNSPLPPPRALQQEVLEVTEGTRVALAYELFARPGAPPPDWEAGRPRLSALLLKPPAAPAKAQAGAAC